MKAIVSCSLFYRSMSLMHVRILKRESVAITEKEVSFRIYLPTF